MSEARKMLSSDLDEAARHAFLEEILKTDAARAASAAGVDVGLTHDLPEPLAFCADSLVRKPGP